MALRFVPNNYLQTNDDLGDPGDGPVSVVTWLRLNAVPGAESGVAGLANSSWSSFQHNININTSGQIKVRLWDGSEKSVLSRILPLGQWQHAAYVFDSNTLFFYLNGQLEGSVAIGACTGVTSGCYFWLARYGSSYAHVDVYNPFVAYSALNPGQIGALAQGERVSEVVGIPQLKAYLNDTMVLKPYGGTATLSSSRVFTDNPPQTQKRISIAGGSPVPLGVDAATVYIDIQPSAVENAQFPDSATITVDLQTSASDTAQFVDSATLLVDLQVESFECHIKWQPTFFGTFSEKWSADMTPKWAFAGAAKWSATMSYGTVADEC